MAEVASGRLKVTSLDDLTKILLNSYSFCPLPLSLKERGTKRESKRGGASLGSFTREGFSLPLDKGDGVSKLPLAKGSAKLLPTV